MNWLSQILFLKSIYFVMFIHRPVWVFVYHVCRCLWKSKDDIGSPGTEVPNGCEFPKVCAGKST